MTRTCASPAPGKIRPEVRERFADARIRTAGRDPAPMQGVPTLSRSRKHLAADRAAAPPARKELLEAMGRPGFAPASLRELLRRLKVDRRHRMAFKRLVRELVDSGDIVRVGKTEYALGAESGAGLVTGRVQRHPDGFGFLVPDSGPEDFYLHPRNLDSIFHGDRVQARIVRRRGRGRAEAIITRVLEPSRRRIMGVFRSGPGEAFVEAYDRSYAAGILLGRGEASGALDGQVVGVEVTQPPSARHPARGRVVEVLGYPDEPGMDVRTVVRKYELRERFSEDVLREAGSHPNPVPAAEIERRADFRQSTIVTMDGETAMDFDDWQPSRSG